MKGIGVVAEKSASPDADAYQAWNLRPQQVNLTIPKVLISNPIQNMASQNVPQRRHKWWRAVMHFISLCIMLLVLLGLGHKRSYRWTSEKYTNKKSELYMSYDSYEIPQPSVRFERCTRYTTLETRNYEFNISGKDSAQWHFLDSANSRTRKHLHGRIVIQPGFEIQSSDIEVKAVLSTNDKADLERVVLNGSESRLAMGYDSNEGIVQADLCTEVEIFVYLRPHRDEILDLVDIRSNILDIWLKEGLAWKVNNLFTHTSYGETTIDALAPSENRMISHNVSMSSTYGSLYGEFIAPKERFDLRTEHGEIGIYLLPDYFRPDTTLDLDSISISTESGDITVLSNFNIPWPEKDYTHRLSVSTDSGFIRSQAPHGSLTNYSSNSGHVSCYLRPYGTSDPSARSDIYTATKSGNLAVRISETFELGKKRHNPNHNTISEHLVGDGMMTLRYGYDWWGILEADITNGTLAFNSSSLVNVEIGDDYVKAQRGTAGESQAYAHVGNGQLDIKLGLGL